MSRVYLSFSLPEDREEFESAWKGAQYKSFIDEFDQAVFRRILKYDDYSLFKDCNRTDSVTVDGFTDVIVEKLREEFWRMFKDEVGE